MKISFSRVLKLVFLLCALHIALFLIMFPVKCIEVGRTAVNLCLNSVVPSLFPFLVCSGIFSATGAATACSRWRPSPAMPRWPAPSSPAATSPARCACCSPRAASSPPRGISDWRRWRRPSSASKWKNNPVQHPNQVGCCFFVHPCGDGLHCGAKSAMI